MKTLIIYYSLDGHTKALAQEMAQEIGADLLEIKPVKEIGKGFMKYFWGGRQVMMGQAPDILPLEKDPSQYEAIIIGSPVWASTFAPPIKSFLAQSAIKGKKIALFCTCGGTQGKTIENFRKELQGNEIVGENSFVSAKRLAENNAKEARNWAKELFTP